MSTRHVLSGILLVAFAGGLLVPSGCGVGEGTGSTPPWVDPNTPRAPAIDPHADEAVADLEAPPIPPYRVKLETTKGDVLIDVNPTWAPRGAARFKELVEAGYYDDNRFFRVVPSFVVQFGMHGDPAVNAAWDNKTITDDRVMKANTRGYVTFATSGPDARTTQVFINLSDNRALDKMSQNFAPFGRVIEGMEVVEALNSQYGEAPSHQQGRIAQDGNAYLDQAFPGLDSIIKATILPPGDAAAE